MRRDWLPFLLVVILVAAMLLTALFGGSRSRHGTGRSLPATPHAQALAQGPERPSGFLPRMMQELLKKT